MSLGLLLLLLSFQTNAAPLPMTGSSAINQIQSGIALSQMGFKLQKFPISWELKKPLDSDSLTLDIGPINPQSKAHISFKTETVSVKTDLEKYVRQYLRDYNQYGFEVIGLQSLKKSSLNSVIVDLNQKNKVTRSRQVFYKKEDKIVSATCIDEFEPFNKTILICNSILETFQWR